MNKIYRGQFMAKLKKQSMIDKLTGINNIQGFFEESKGLINLAQRHKLSLALMYFDINNLKTINNTYDNETGDLLIKLFSDALSQSIREEDIIARLDGDEFCFLGINSDDYDFIVLESRVQSIFSKLTQDNNKISNPTFSSSNKLFEHTGKFNIESMLSEVKDLISEDKKTRKEYLQSIG
ncbi:MAG: hypothetical protein DIZ80_03415 [endosymbiont of Galathealinum brachiosum]|uniref:diguanylate cyclase n=1 Tax=endosymbiont of Galathealinum brachiosum TaxID=2200906 RepID=A0A370DJI1_9GAMM|nr:MAG: hypothetical protein DIZ80_03415 [endosymbiont of Galathealinum brachiosum]